MTGPVQVRADLDQLRAVHDDLCAAEDRAKNYEQRKAAERKRWAVSNAITEIEAARSPRGGPVSPARWEGAVDLERQMEREKEWDR